MDDLTQKQNEAAEEQLTEIRTPKDDQISAEYGGQQFAKALQNGKAFSPDA